MFAPQKIPSVGEQLEQREWSLQHMIVLSTSHQRPLRGFPGISRYFRTCRLQAGTLQFSLCAREVRPVCTQPHWEAPGKEENYRATRVGPVTPVWLIRKANYSTRNLSESRKKQLLFALGWGTEGGQGSRAPIGISTRAARAKQEAGVDKRISHANSILFSLGKKSSY